MPKHGEARAASKEALSRRTVVDAVLALIQEDGLDAVSIRRLADRLGVTPMALYWHFRNKDELLDATAARLFEQVSLPDAPAWHWQVRLRALLGSLLTVLRGHREAAPLLATRTVTSDSALDATESLLDALRQAGFSPAEATQVARHALSAVSNLVSGQPGVVVGETSGASPDDRRRAAETLAALPTDRYPRLVEAATPLSEGIDSESYFAFGLDLILAGIEAMARDLPGHRR